MISRNQTDWSFKEELVSIDELELVWDIVENFFIYTSNILYENCIRK